MGKYIEWSIKRLIKSICDRLMNKFDVLLVIEGKRGLGKSTLGYILMKRVKKEMKKRGVEGYKFHPYRDILYSRKEVLRFFHKWKHSGMADEMINVTFNRDFYNTDQKDIIKIINMNRDHNNFFIACVPQFKNLDSQIKNLTSMKITIVRRGVALIHMPNKTVYSSDIWDERVNEKIEREWLKGGVTNPQYSRLTTFRGYLRFPKLTPKQEAIYQKIKNEKRNIIAKEKGLDELEKEKTPLDTIFDLLIQYKIKNMAMLEGMLLAHNLNVNGSKIKLRNKLKKRNMHSTLKDYFIKEKTKSDVIKEKKRSEISELIADIKKSF